MKSALLKCTICIPCGSFPHSRWPYCFGLDWSSPSPNRSAVSRRFASKISPTNESFHHKGTKVFRFKRQGSFSERAAGEIELQPARCGDRALPSRQTRFFIRRFHEFSQINGNFTTKTQRHEGFDANYANHRELNFVIIGEIRVNNSRQTPDAALDVKQQAGIAQDLKLLANLIPNMPACPV